MAALARAVADSRSDLEAPLLGGPGKGAPSPAIAASVRAKSAARLSPWQNATSIVVTVAACGAWMCASSWAILVNKIIMVDLKFAYPCTIAWMGLATTTLLSFLAIKLVMPAIASLRSSSSSSGDAGANKSHGGADGAASPAAGGGEAGGKQLGAGGLADKMTWQVYGTRVLPTGCFMALTFVCGNTGYLYLTVAFVQMLKAFCPVVTMLLLFAAGLEAVSARLVAAVCLIAGGVALASYGELNMSLVGLFFMLSSVVGESVRLVLTQHLLVAAGGGPQLHPLEGLFYISSACTAVLAVLAAATEWPRMLERGDAGVAFGYPLHFATAALCGFAVNTLAILVIKLASSLTLKVLGTVKDALLVAVGIVFLHEAVSALQLVGYSISLVGFVSYNYIKASQAGQAALGGAVGPAGTLVAATAGGAGLGDVGGAAGPLHPLAGGDKGGGGAGGAVVLPMLHHVVVAKAH